MQEKILCGTYTDNGSKGIYQFDYDNGKIENVSLFSQLQSPKYLAKEGDYVASLCDYKGGAGVALLDSKGNLLDQLAYENRTGCFVTIHNGVIYTANYHEGQVAIVDIVDHRLKLRDMIRIRDGAGCHQVLFKDSYILIPCLFLDRILIFDQDLKYIQSIPFAQGTGPRHGVFTKDQKHLYLVSELSNELFEINTDTWEIERSIGVLENGKKHVRDTAAIRMNEDESCIYVSTRTQDVLSVIDVKEMKLKQVVYCGGRHPRDFILKDNQLLCANRFSDNVVSFALEADGTIGEEIGMVNIKQGVSLLSL